MKTGDHDGTYYHTCYNCNKMIRTEKYFDARGKQFCSEACRDDHNEHDVDDQEHKFDRNQG